MKRTIILIIVGIFISCGLCFAICKQYFEDRDCPYLSENFNWKDVEKEAIIYYNSGDVWHKITAEPGKAYVMLGQSFPSIYPNSENYVKFMEEQNKLLTLSNVLWTHYKED